MKTRIALFVAVFLALLAFFSFVSFADDKWYIGIFEGQWAPSFRNFTLTISEKENGELSAVYEYGSTLESRLNDNKRLGGKSEWVGKVVSNDKIVIGTAPSPVITLTRSGDGKITTKWEWKNNLPSYATLKRK